jgi:F-type H+-transporting ATPase subunit delta
MKVTARQYAQTLFEVIQDLPQQQVPQIIAKFVAQIKHNGDLTHSKGIISAFGEIYDRAYSIVAATVTSARSLTDEQKEGIEAFIKKKYDAKDVNLAYAVDEGITGGIIIRVGDEIIDASVKGRMLTMKQYLMSK